MAPLFLVLFAAFLVPPPVYVVGGQAGFLSIDCGLDDGSNSGSGGYPDSKTGIDYVPDGHYVDAGENHKVSPGLDRSSFTPLQTLRSFPSGQRNCYALPTVARTKYLVRAEFEYGNYDAKNSSSSLQFDLHLGANYWRTVYPDATTSYDVYEAVFVAWAGWAPVCLIDTGRGTPFVSVLELRPLGDGLYPQVAHGLILSLYRRLNMGGAVSTTRYRDDPCDRFWWPMESASPRWANKTAQGPIKVDASPPAPSAVLATAVAAAGNDRSLTAVTWQDDSKSNSYVALLHFADFQNTQLREFNIYVGENDPSGQQELLSPPYMTSRTVYTQPFRAKTDGKYNITLAATNASVLPPMINALEIYLVVPDRSLTTLPSDFDAIMAIKYEYGVKKNWMGDPCFPTKYTWAGVKCGNTSGNTTRITYINLSNSNLHGAISKNFALLTSLQNLDLSYNNLSGLIPDSIPSLTSLRVLNVSGNQLSDDSLCKSYTGSLIFRHDSSKSMCNKKITASRKNTVILVTSVVVVLLVVSAIVLACFICRSKRKSTVSIDDPTRNAQPEIAPRSKTDQGDHLQDNCVQTNHLQDNENRRFTYKDLEKFTDNFKQFIGQGGFGLVYFGHLEDGTEVAVKMCSESSSHGLDEFLAEVQSLTKVHHRNIVSLVGYCWEEDHLALVYEYMSQGNLYDHLRGKIAAAETLMSWGTRVQIVLESAQGLDYLHKGCSPPIIHRDVKSSNILLGQNLQAKIADLGLSKTYISDGHTHISATAAGTAGYMDPEYYFTGRLTENSDVYSFGVVLLEAATGEPPLVPGQGHIVQRVKQRVAATGDIGSIADPRLRAAYDVNSMWKVVDTAMACTAESGAGRPTMSEVVAQLKDSLALEDARDNDDRSVPASIAASDSAGFMMSGFGPSAR